MDNMEQNLEPTPDTDDLPLCANTKHILVRHYALDLTVHFHRKVISGCVVLFLEPVAPAEHTSHSSAPQADYIESSSHSDFTLVLDCCDLNVSKVEPVDVASLSAAFPGVCTDDLIRKLASMPSADWRQQQELFSQCSRAPAEQDGGSLRFCTDRWSLRVRKQGVSSPWGFPRALRICYETRPTGSSIRWTQDQDDRACVYTAGSPINNRALFPCQEPPVAMSTWQATVRAPKECVVLMSGEEQVAPTEGVDTSFSIWHYYVAMPMPASTFTLAVGHWQQVTPESLHVSSQGGSSSEVTSMLHTGSGDQAASNNSPMLDDGFPCSHGDYPCRFKELSVISQRVIPHRVFAPVSLLQKAQIGVLALLPQCLAAAHAILGVHPFPRLDVLIVPSGFSSLGMASPHIIFLSQSVLHVGISSLGVNSRSLCGSRLCHEIAHSWFGLVIGAKDWTEEWISEGFATYLEDIIWAQAQQLPVQESLEQFNLKALLRWRRLSDELQNSGEELQILRPNMEKTGQVSESGSSTVKHALNPDKSFLQVHYLKGYFFLRFLANQVGEQPFINFFKSFVKQYHGQLILSQWLHERSAVWSRSTPAEEVKAEVAKWILLSRSHQGKGRKRKRSEADKVNYKEMTSEQLVLLLELLLEETELSLSTMRTLARAYHLQNQDAEVRHRWCELVVKHGHAEAYGDVEHFLRHDQAMGVYLYGELMLQEDAEQQALARRCLSLVSEEMDQSARRVVEEMVL
ncbi:aminopeptidase O isoform X2 [Entelurus aequoreus]|uniref:aminopeptidase O isoform X2 n=1 Tax=Entelurus aequoreus TaxID=161455 RepID=UPI002B1E1C33|nr:aminopeptidase O isoform X2 [Entelurus aequoreus]